MNLERKCCIPERGNSAVGDYFFKNKESEVVL
jgi:hypothetical protein